jgi:nucleoside-triphosphatase
MRSKSAKILLTGLPGCGKTTAIMRILDDLDRRKAAGFYTEEIRENNSRKGFRWTTLDGNTGILAHVNIKGPHKVAKYGVDVRAFERSVVPLLDIERGDADLFVIDEIGKMECFSREFVTAIRWLFASDRSVLASVAKKGGGLISEVKGHPGTKLFNLTQQTRDKIIEEILQLLLFLKQ